MRKEETIENKSAIYIFINIYLEESKKAHVKKGQCIFELELSKEWNLKTNEMVAVKFE